MTAPTFVSATSTVFNNQNAKTTASIAVQNGDLLIATRYEENARNGGLLINTASGSTSAWTTLSDQPGSVDGSRVGVFVAKATATATGNITVQATTNSTIYFGLMVTVWRNHNGTGAVNANNNGTSSGAPTVSITTTGDNSGIVYVSGDWNATAGTVTFTASNGTPVQDLSDQSTAGANYCNYGSHVVDAGTAGAKTMGMSAPSTQRYIAVAVEVLGISSASVTPGIDVVPVGIRRKPGLGPTAKRVMPRTQPASVVVVAAPPITGSTLPTMGVG